jgi:large subunit ribosomal protein L9
VDKKRIHLPGHIKTTGDHSVTVELHADVVATVPLNVSAQ